eukprot:11207219-Lingulodinium_polyedra.AAC.1
MCVDAVTTLSRWRPPIQSSRPEGGWYFSLQALGSRECIGNICAAVSFFGQKPEAGGEASHTPSDLVQSCKANV